MRFAICLIFVCALWRPVFAANVSVPFREIYDLLRTNLAGVSEAQLDHAAAAGLIEHLRPKVTVADAKDEAASAETNGPLAKASLFDRSYVSVRVSQFAPGTEKSFIEAYRQIASTNRLKGLIVDLRYSQGQDYEQAAAMADWFFRKEEPLLDWGQGLKKSSAKTNALELPLAVLVNHKTSGAPEAFAAILRQAQIGEVIGTNTAGAAAIAKEFVLSNGQRLRVATAPIQLANGKAFPADGLKPDIHVEINPEDELAWVEDAYKTITKTSGPGIVGTNEVAALITTNRAGRRRINEAELVRMLREGINPDNETATGAREIERNKGLVMDPVLSRALDLLKGLTVVQHFKSS